jgi:hypothetical protein
MSHPREWHPGNARDGGRADMVGAKMLRNLWQTHKDNVEAAWAFARSFDCVGRERDHGGGEAGPGQAGKALRV